MEKFVPCLVYTLLPCLPGTHPASLPASSSREASQHSNLGTTLNSDTHMDTVVCLYECQMRTLQLYSFSDKLLNSTSRLLMRLLLLRPFFHKLFLFLVSLKLMTFDFFARSFTNYSFCSIFQTISREFSTFTPIPS